MSAQIGELGPFRLLTKGDELPVFAFTLHDDVTNYSVFDVSAALRERGWQVPAYTFPADREDLAALRIVVRNGTGREMADLLLDDLAHVLPRLQQQAEPIRGTDAKGFAHATAQRKAGPSPMSRRGLGPNPHARVHGLRATPFVDHV